MLVISFETNKSREVIINKAIEFFKEAVGLEISEQDRCCIFFGDELKGYARLTLSEKNENFEVKVESREFEYWAKKFLREF